MIFNPRYELRGPDLTDPRADPDDATPPSRRSERRSTPRSRRSSAHSCPRRSAASAACSRERSRRSASRSPGSRSHDLRLALVISAGLAVVLLVLRIVQRSTVQFVFNSMVGIGIAAVFALRSGRAEDAFLPGLIYNAVLRRRADRSRSSIRWPLVGFMIGSVTGDPTGWHKDKQLVALCSKLTLMLAAPCVLRVIVQYPLWAAHQAGWLGIAKLAMGWPLQLAVAGDHGLGAQP